MLSELGITCHESMQFLADDGGERDYAFGNGLAPRKWELRDRNGHHIGETTCSELVAALRSACPA